MARYAFARYGTDRYGLAGLLHDASCALSASTSPGLTASAIRALAAQSAVQAQAELAVDSTVDTTGASALAGDAGMLSAATRGIDVQVAFSASSRADALANVDYVASSAMAATAGTAAGGVIILQARWLVSATTGVDTRGLGGTVRGQVATLGGGSSKLIVANVVLVVKLVTFRASSGTTVNAVCNRQGFFVGSANSIASGSAIRTLKATTTFLSAGDFLSDGFIVLVGKGVDMDSRFVRPTIIGRLNEPDIVFDPERPVIEPLLSATYRG